MTAVNKPILLFVGTMTRDSAAHFPNACGDGIVAFSLDPKTGELFRLSDYHDTRSPSYLACPTGQRRLHAVECTFDMPGRLCSFEFDNAGFLSLIDAAPASGLAACHVCVLPGGDAVCTTSYLDASLDLFSIRDGKIAPRPATHKYHGRGPNVARQDAAHAHQAVVDPPQKRLYVCDLGSDCIWIHELSGAMPAANPRRFSLPAGSGPRHLAFHPTRPRAYILTELTGRVFTCAWEPVSGDLRMLHDHPGLPAGWTGTPAGSAIRVHPSGRSLFAAQRNHHSLAVYQLADGVPNPAGHLPSGGCEPRDFIFDPSGNWMIVANQYSNNLAVFELDAVTGLPSGRPGRSTAVNSPACVICAQGET